MVFVLMVAAASMVLGTAYADTEQHASPYQQIRDSIPLDSIQCNGQLQLYIRDSQTPLCLTASGFDLLVKRGMDIAMPEDVMPAMDDVQPENETQPEDVMPPKAPAAEASTLSELVGSINDAGDAEVRMIVEWVVEQYKADDKGTISSVNGLSDHTSVPHYPFIVDSNDKTILAHGANPVRIGSVTEVFGDHTVNTPEDVIAELGERDGVWAEYTFIDPASSRESIKRSWITMHDGKIFGAGHYPSIKEKLTGMLDNTIQLVDTNGKGIQTYDIINTYPLAGEHARIIDAETFEILADRRNLDTVRTTVTIGFFDIDDVDHDVESDILEHLHIGESHDAERIESLDTAASVYQYADNPATGERAATIGMIKYHDGLIYHASYTYPVEDKVKQTVADAIERYDSEEGTFDSIAGDLFDPHYPFVVDPESGKIIAHGASPGRVGTQSVLFGGSADVTPDEIRGLEEGQGAWVGYDFPLASSERLAGKVSWLVKHDGYIFGAGYYTTEHPVLIVDSHASRSESSALSELVGSINDAGDDEVRMIVEWVVDQYKADDKGTISSVNGLSDHTSVPHYPFIVDSADRIILAHGADPDRIGSPTAVFGDYSVNNPDDVIRELEVRDGVWAEYTFIDPASGRESIKRSWITMHDGKIFGAGYHPPIGERLEAMLDNTIKLVGAEGNRAYDTIDTYPLAGEHARIIDAETFEILADRRNLDAVGSTVAIGFFDIDDVGHVESDILAHLHIDEGSDAENAEMIRNLDTGASVYQYAGNAATIGMIKYHDGLIYYASYTYPVEDKVKRAVENIMELYDSEEGAFDSIAGDLFDPHYPFVVDPESGKIIAHGASPERVGTQSVLFGGSADVTPDEIRGLEEGQGAWVGYDFPLASSERLAGKVSWLVKHDGYIFGAGYYTTEHPVLIIR